MATKTVIVDDMDGSTAEHHVVLSVNDQTVELDLSEKNRKALDSALSQFFEAGTPVRSRARRGRAGGVSRQVDYDIKALRRWAEEMGVEVPSRGRPKASVVGAFKQAIADGWEPKTDVSE